MRLVGMPRPLASLVGMTAVLTILVLASPVAATSCVPMEMQLKDLEPGTAVLVGTVAGRDPSGVQVRVDQWFAGAHPHDAVTIPLPGPNGPIIAGTWDPRPGEAWFIVGERTGPKTIESNVCRQVPLDASLVALATDVFGPPSTPPFGDSGDPDGGEEEPSSELPVALVIGVGALGLLLGLGAVVAYQRRAA